MFGYLKLFALASLVAVVLIAGLIGMYFRAQVGANLEDIAEQGNVAIARAFTETVWRPYREQLVQSVADTNFAATATQFARGMPVVAIRVYNTRGILLFTTGGTSLASDFTAQTQAAIREADHVPSYAVAAGEAGLMVDGNANAVLIKSFVPIGIGAVEGYVEVFRDINSAWQKLFVLQWIASGSVIIVFMILMWVLVLVSKKAEGIIARQHEANMELAAAAASAQAENREKSLFLANISHELRTPLNAIIGFSDIIRTELMGEVKNQKYHDYVSDIHSSGVHLLSLINDILDFSKAEAGKLELEVEEVNAIKMVGNCLRLVSPRAEAGAIELVNGMPKEQLVLETDSKKFKQILLNLLSNAVKFTPAGGRVSVGCWQDLTEDAIVFEITDTGIGIAAKDIAKAMAPFGQVDNTLARKYEGTGLGLPLTKKFIELMGGKFGIKSELNVGTTITFSLPRLFKPKGDLIYKRAS